MGITVTCMLAHAYVPHWLFRIQMYLHDQKIGM